MIGDEPQIPDHAQEHLPEAGAAGASGEEGNTTNTASTTAAKRTKARGLGKPRPKRR